MGTMASLKQKTHVIWGTPNQHNAIAELNKTLASGWKVVQVHVGNGDATFWFVVTEERLAGSGAEGD
jgi:hypothetical protein